MPIIVAATGPGFCDFPGCDTPGEFPLVLWIGMAIVVGIWAVLIVALVRRG
jgi:hypothetical protein